MAEPTSVTAGALAAALSTATLALLGVDYYSLLWALIGALMALSRSEQMGRGKAILFVLLATLAGAVLGTFAVTQFELRARIALIGLSWVGGLVAQAFASAIFRAAPGLTGVVVTGIESAIKRVFPGSKA